MASKVFVKTPVSYWIITVLGLVWFAGGASDYVMVNYKVESYLANFTETQLAYLENRPFWFSLAWGVSIWCSVLGALAMLIRSHFAPVLFFVSIFGFAAALYYSYVVYDPAGAEFHTAFSHGMNAAIAISLLFFYVYTRRKVVTGVLT